MEKDDIPAMLTEGEYVIKADSAKSIGYDNLDSINKNGVLPTTDARNRKKVTNGY